MKVMCLIALAGLFLYLVVVLDKWIRLIRDFRWQLLARSFLYAFVFTPTAYHHAPNTIVAPLHLSSLSGNLFYGYEYTFAMFAWGVVMPISIGWALCMLVLLFRFRLPQSV